jgi:hypothetical protein
MEISMSHSTSKEERGWDYGLEDNDVVALAHCQRIGSGPLDWVASSLVQYIAVRSLREAWRSKKVVVQKPKGAQEGFEVRVTWPSAIAKEAGTIEKVNADSIRYRKTSDGRGVSLRLKRKGGALKPLVNEGVATQPNQVIASVVAVTTAFPCGGGADARTYLALLKSTALSDRYTAVKALSRIESEESTRALVERVHDQKEHIYVRVDAAAGLMRRRNGVGRACLAATLKDNYLENRLEAAIVLSEVGTPEAAKLLIETLNDADQHAEIRAGAAWSLGELGAQDALPNLVRSFAALEMPIRIEAARALAKLSKKHLAQVLESFPVASAEERPGVAWALSKAAHVSISQLLPALVDEDARHWVAYVIGTQDRERLLPEIEQLATRDPQVYFAVTVLWKILASWVYDLEEY